MIAITGSPNGFLSSYLYNHCQPAEFINRDTRKSSLLLNAWLNQFKPECVIHCAGLADVRACIGEPAMAYEANTMDTIRLLNAMEGRRLKLIYIATDKVFGDQENCTLDTPFKPLNSYDRSKVAAEIVVDDWSRRNVCAIARFPNFYGLNDPHSERLFPSVLKAIADKREVFEVRTNADATRQYIFIEDAVSIIKILINSVCDSSKHHFGTNYIKSVRAVIEDLCQMFGTSMQIKEQQLAGEANKLSLAYCSPLKVEFTGWWESLKKFVDSKTVVI